MVKQDLKLCLEMSFPGPHVFLVIMTVGRITEQEKYTLKYMSEMFGDQAFLNHTILVITRKEDLNLEIESDDDDEEYDRIEDLDKFILDSEDLNRIVKQCGNRCLAVSNSGEVDSSKRKREAQRIIQSVNQLIENNNGVCYSNNMFKELEIRKEFLRKEEEDRKQKLLERYRKEEIERKKEIDRRYKRIEFLERKVEEITEKLEMEQLTSDDKIQEIRNELEELR